MKSKPGQTVPDSGIWSEVGPKGGKTPHKVTVVEGEPFPPTHKPGNGFVPSVLPHPKGKAK